MITPGTAPSGSARPPAVVEGTGSRYRPGEIMINTADVERASGVLATLGAVRDQRLDPALRPYVTRYLVPAGTDTLAVIKRVRAASAERPVRVGANHVFAGEPVYQGGPGSPPAPARAITEPATPTGVGTGARVAVLDTGVAADAQRRHPLLGHRYLAAQGDIDPLDTDRPADGLDDQAGHGTFVAGIIAMLAPEAGLIPIRVLSSDGLTDEITVALGLLRAAEAGADVINLSLGGYTEDDQAPVVLEAVLDRLDPGIAVVAAAGNAGSRRLFWPAAFKRVLAVAALDTTRGRCVPAPFSNHGWWVDACAPGTRVRSCFVAGKRVAEDHSVVAFDGYASWDGTSFAAPHVAAMIARRVGTGLPAAMAAAELLTDAKADRLPGYGVVLRPATDLVNV